jgi:hypothetical protein
VKVVYLMIVKEKLRGVILVTVLSTVPVPPLDQLVPLLGLLHFL